MADISHGQLILMHATVCCFSALYVDFPALIGCSGKDECLCYESQCCLKLNTASLGLSLSVCNGSDFIRLKLILYEFALKMPTVLCKAKNQFFCCASQAAFPPDKDVPIMCAICFIALFPSIGICQKVSQEDSVNDVRKVHIGH